MVRKGKMATVIVCKEAEVKHPVVGSTRAPVQGKVMNGMSTVRQVQEVGEIPFMPVQSVEQKAGEASSVHVVRTERKAEVLSAAKMEKIESETGVREGCPVPVKWKEVQEEVSKEFVIPERIEEMVPAMQRCQIVRADDSMTLTQLFSEK